MNVPSFHRLKSGCQRSRPRQCKLHVDPDCLDSVTVKQEVRCKLGIIFVQESLDAPVEVTRGEALLCG
eukprot:CAMPEP_0172901554 /NCGR_PEP_ID=MMETSP1075-20121228/166512_1 /TAXON_ID=2916 /ORGANISM="Ceratium fusus, Strain PA161109" /LENGTH=67 /DNA_ID=CAMNT_0013757977 /DNA_START=89 /DNA_END=292 /DNA_ORIENTATION=-